MIEVFITLTVGLVFGSFANNIISYFANNTRFDFVKSTCMCGKKELHFYELIPLFSFLFLKGKCSKCGVKLTKRYFIIEIIGGLLALICYNKYGLSLELALYFFSFLLMVVIAVIDFSRFIIPNSLLSGLLIFALINLFLSETQAVMSVVGALLLMGVFIAINFFYSKHSSSEAIGYGDIKYIGILTLLFSFPLSLFGLWLSALLAIPGSYILKYLFSKYRDEKKIPFGLFLSISYLITSLFDNMLSNGYSILYRFLGEF